MIYFLLVIFLLFGFFHLPFLFWVHHKNISTPLDWIYPFFPIGIWILLTFFGIGSQSLSNLVEIPIIGGMSLFFNFIAIITPFPKNHSKKMFCILIVMMIFSIGIRFFMPLIPE